MCSVEVFIDDERVCVLGPNPGLLQGDQLPGITVFLSKNEIHQAQITRAGAGAKGHYNCFNTLGQVVNTTFKIQIRRI